MRNYILIFSLIGFVTHVSAQQIQTTSFYDIQGIFHNPSIAGVKGNVAGVTYRSQWTGISGGPRTAMAFGAFDVPEMKIGIGGFLYNDKTGPTSRTALQLSFAKHIPTQSGMFSIGLEARGQQYSLDKAKLIATLGADPAIGNSENRFVFDAGIGVSYSDNKLQIGASVSNLVQSKLNFYTGLSTTETARLYRHYFLHGTYKWAVDNSSTITPNFLIIYLPNAPTEYQFGARVEHNELFWWGLNYHIKQSWQLSAGVNVQKKFTIAYAFDIYSSPISVFDVGSYAHEILLKINMPKK